MTEFLGVMIVVHVAANLVWIGAITATAWILPSSIGSPSERGKLGLAVYRQLAVPAMLLSLVAALSRLFSSLDLYFVVMKYMHAKLLFAVIVLALHHVIGARARAMALGKRDDPGYVKLLGVIILVSSAVAVYLAVLKPF